MQPLEQTQISGTNSIGPDLPGVPNLPDRELPLQRIYACEHNSPLQPLFTQPINGQILDWSWASAMQEVRRMAAWIEAQGWPPGSNIVIVSKNCAWWIMADFAIWMSGHVSVPFFPTARDLSLAALFRHCQPVACFIGSLESPLPLSEDIFHNLRFVAFPNCAPQHTPAGSALWSDIIATQSPLAADPVRTATDVATIIYTSGTTGQPKGAVHNFRALTLWGKSMEPAVGVNPTEGIDRILSYLPLAHIAERAIVEMNALISPLHIFFTEGQPTFLPDLIRSRSTLFFSIPRLYIRFQQGVFEKIHEKKLNLLLSIPILGNIVRKKILANLGLGGTRLICSGGAAIPVDIIVWYRKMGLNFLEGYGMTETGITHVPLPGQMRIGYVGNASPWALTRISADGEVQIKGPMNMLGYYRHPELTREVFTGDGFFRTGDRGEIDELGRLRLVGRLKEEFKTSKGKYVAPAQIEKLLSCSYLFESVAVFGSGMTAPFAMAVLAPPLRKDLPPSQHRADIEAKLAAELNSVNAHLEHHEQLRFIVISEQPWTIDNELLTPTLKVRRATLEQRYSPRFASWENSQTKIIWMESL
ncbi:MAG TPA: AMP-binding protein [Acidobacteriaceae bacterium]|nr:AMP-binding protein [Acidobacteriaceae bacterium]